MQRNRGLAAGGVLPENKCVDQETELFYNYFRDYDPQTGRYVQSDPIGLAGGINTYGYANQNPLRYVDPLGLVGDSIDGGARPSPPIGVPNPSAEAQRQLAQQLTEMLRQLRDKLLCEPEKKPCPPCKFADGSVVPVGTVGYRFDILPADRAQHGIPGPHLNLYKANQNPNNCQCFWQPIGTVKPPPQPNWIPIQPFVN